MAKRRTLGHTSSHHAMKSALIKFIDENNITGSAAATTAAWEARLDDVEDDTVDINSRLNYISSSVDTNIVNIQSLGSSVVSNATAITAEEIRASAAESALQIDIDQNEASAVSLVAAEEAARIAANISIDSNILSLSSGITTLSGEISDLSSSLTALSSSVALLSASIGSGGSLNVNIPSDSELYFNGDTLMTDAAVYISGAGNNLYLHGTNDQGVPAKFEFSIVNGGTIIAEVPHSDFGDEIDDPWFKFDGDTLLTHADIYVSGTNNYLYLNGTDENGEYGIFYFDIVNGQVIIEQTGSIN